MSSGPALFEISRLESSLGTNGIENCGTLAFYTNFNVCGDIGIAIFVTAYRQELTSLAL